MLALFGNIGAFELVVILVIAVLVFGKDLPQAATKAYMQLRKLRSAVDDLRRDSGIERELRDIERSVREAEWEARRSETARPAAPNVPRASLPPASGAASESTGPETAPPPPPT